MRKKKFLPKKLPSYQRLRSMQTHTQSRSVHVCVDVGEAAAAGAAGCVCVCLTGLRGCRILHWSFGNESIWDKYRTIKPTWTNDPSVPIWRVMMALKYIYLNYLSCLPVVIKVLLTTRARKWSLDVFNQLLQIFLFFLFSTVRQTFFTSLGHATL